MRLTRQFFAATLICSTVWAQGNRMQQNVYLETVSYQGISASGCTRLLDASGAYGCTAPSTTNGILYRVASQGDIQTFVNGAPSGAVYTVVMPTSLLTKESLATIKASGKLAGILLIKDASSALPTAYSIDSTTPNAQYGLYANQDKNSWYPWNPQGNGLAYVDLGVAIFELYGFNQASQQTIGTINEALDSNAARGYTGYPLYSMQFDGLMWAAINSQTCLRRGRCTPVGGYSVWSTFSTNFSPADKKPLIFVNAKLDSTALIHDFAFGAAQRSGLVTMLAVVEALSRAPMSLASLPKTVIFAAFAAETYAFAGSQRFVLDLTTPFTCKDSSGAFTAGCPLNGAQCNAPCRLSTSYTNISFNLIESIIEFDTIGGLTSTNAPSGHFLHVDTANTQNEALVGQFAGSFSGPSLGLPSTVNSTISRAYSTTKNNRLPPSSAMAFLSAGNISAVVVSDYQDSFSNNYYNSELDDGSVWGANNVASICGVVGATANSIYKIAGGTTNGTITPNCTLVAALLDCFTRNIACSYLTYLANSSFVPGPITGYTSVFDPSLNTIHPLSIYTQLMLANWTASARLGDCSHPLCATPSPGYSCIANQCLATMTQLHQAYGTGLDMDENTGSFTVFDPNKGTWTESTWKNLRVRIFRAASIGYQSTQLVIGIAMTLVTIGATFVAQRKGFM